MKIVAYQMAGGNDYARNLRICRHSASLAAQADAKLLLLPEAAMFLRAQESEATMTQSLDGEFVSLLADLSREYGLTIVAGMFEPAPQERAFNTAVVLQAGRLLGTYRKLHLYDALAVQESKRIAQGEDLPPVFDCEGITFGVMTCYDLRFPETARALAEQGADVILLPAAWFAGAEGISLAIALRGARFGKRRLCIGRGYVRRQPHRAFLICRCAGHGAYAAWSGGRFIVRGSR